jgi:hypothetical protein
MQMAPQDFLSPAMNVFNSQWSEVVYFVYPQSTVTTGTDKAGTYIGTQLFSLYRRQLIACNKQSDADYVNGVNPVGPHLLSYSPSNIANYDNVYYEVSCQQDPAAGGFLYVNGPNDLTIPERRFGLNATAGSAGVPVVGFPTATQPPYTYPTLATQLNLAGGVHPAVGDDLLLSNVVSMTVQVMAPAVSLGFTDLASLGVLQNNSVIAALQGGNVYVFDTWSQGTSGPYDYSTAGTHPWNAAPPTGYTIPMKVNIRALQIILRIWDQKTERTRQITIIQDM